MTKFSFRRMVTIITLYKKHYMIKIFLNLFHIDVALHLISIRFSSNFSSPKRKNLGLYKLFKSLMFIMVVQEINIQIVKDKVNRVAYKLFWNL